MTRKTSTMILVAATICGALVLAAGRARDAAGVATGFVAHVLCSQTFVSGLDPDQVFAETTAAMPGSALMAPAMDYRIDRARKDVTVTLLGGARSHAMYRDGMGCSLTHGDETFDGVRLPAESRSHQALLPEIADDLRVQTTNPDLKLALDRAFAEPARPPFRHTHAVVVLKDGRIVGERYAPGYAVDTPLLGWSATKSAISALIGILVRRGKLRVDAPAPVAAWQNPHDPRHVITVDQLLRHTTGLAMGSSLHASIESAFDRVNRMKYLESDMAGFAESSDLATTPGRAWNYHDGNYVILSRLIRDAAGGHAADVLRFARAELFEPLGMRNVTLEFDATGTPEGSSQMLAPARDWARLGALYLDDGVIAGQRILPKGWVDYSATPTLGAWVGYGAGFWTNRGDSFGAKFRTGLGWPAESFYASGTFGQYVIIVPSERLVIVRFGITGGRYDIEGVSRLVTDVIAATRGNGHVAVGEGSSD